VTCAIVVVILIVDVVVVVVDVATDVSSHGPFELMSSNAQTFYRLISLSNVTKLIAHLLSSVEHDIMTTRTVNESDKITLGLCVVSCTLFVTNQSIYLFS